MSNVPQAGAVQQIGGVYNASFPSIIIPKDENVVVLFGGKTTPTAERRQIFTRGDLTSQIQAQITAAKTFKAPGFYFTCDSASEQKIVLGYNTGTFADDSAIGAGDIYFGKGTSAAATPTVRVIPAASIPVFIPFPIVFPANSYPFWIVASNSGYTVTIVGREV